MRDAQRGTNEVPQQRLATITISNESTVVFDTTHMVYWAHREHRHDQGVEIGS